jgi:hypothetical protein
MLAWSSGQNYRPSGPGQQDGAKGRQGAAAGGQAGAGPVQGEAHHLHQVPLPVLLNDRLPGVEEIEDDTLLGEGARRDLVGHCFSLGKQSPQSRWPLPHWKILWPGPSHSRQTRHSGSTASTIASRRHRPSHWVSQRPLSFWRPFICLSISIITIINRISISSTTASCIAANMAE